ncbi:DinB family protein [Metaplanococcus flavidus]|uniref:DinB family protein n=1 Tax=Metaplanococcus flavidus TaxID=569883 RepID=A0ABW3L829_9BACL
MFKEDNERIRRRILESAERFSDDQLNHKPAEGKWSAMQILDHLQLMENVIARNIAKELERGSSKKAVKKPIQLTVSRTIKVDAPSYTQPSADFIDLAEMKSRLETSRNQLNQIFDNASKETLKSKSLPHPVFGKVPLIQWFPFVGLHEKRHFKQLEDTLSKINGQTNQ